MWIGFRSLTLTLLLGQTKDLVFQKVALTYDVSLAAKVIAKQVPAEQIEGPDWEGPAHLAFAFQDSYASRHTPASYLQTPEIRIYRIADFRRALPETGDTLRELRSLLSYDRLDRWKGEIPYLPQYAAIELFHCRVKAVQSSSMAGVRFLAAYAQDAREISNERLYFVFSGLSNDGKYYLVAHFPVFVSKLESDQWIKLYEQILTRDLSEESAEYKRYINSVIGSLETRGEEQFNPPLALLDEVLQSIDVSHIRF